MAKPTGIILAETTSYIDGQPIVVIATLKSSNRKTGNQIQVYILRSDVPPLEAIASGGDYSICGDCKHRKDASGVRTCYVNVAQSVNSVWKAYQRGSYSHCKRSELASYFEGRSVRLGAYGDPALIPADIVREVLHASAKHTGFTHRWRDSEAAVFKGLLMASCDNTRDWIEATLDGWQTFNVTPQGKAPVSPTLKQCPASVASSEASCLTCSLCNGAKTSIYVPAHGVNGSKVQ